MVASPYPACKRCINTGPVSAEAPPGKLLEDIYFQRNVISPFSRAISDENVITLRCKYCIYVYWKTSVIFYFNFALFT